MVGVIWYSIVASGDTADYFTIFFTYGYERGQHPTAGVGSTRGKTVAIVVSPELCMSILGNIGSYSEDLQLLFLFLLII